MSDDPFDLKRFVDAQSAIYDDVLAELSHGRKTTHWMWFIFPQLRALGRSSTARRFGISSEKEACAYLEHSVLGTRLRQCVDILLHLGGTDPHAIFGSPDDMKLRSSLTLFCAVAPKGESRFKEALAQFYPNGPDETTLGLLA